MQWLIDWFALPLLLQTLIAPWKRDLQTGQGLNLRELLQMILDNTISRIFGFIIRFSTFLVGILVVSVTGLVAILATILWIGLPLIIVFLLAFGVRAFSGGL